MELRKLQLTGGSSFTVTLPKEWIEKSKLAAGDVVGVAPLPDGSLSIHPHARLAARQARYEIDLKDETAEALFRKVVAAYLAGYDVVAIKSRKPILPAARRAAREAVKRIIGLEVVEEEANSIVLQDFLDPREFHIDKGLRRMQGITRSMQEDALAALTGAESSADVLAERDDEVDRLHWMINKQFHAILRDPTYAQRMELNANQALDYLQVARLIERVADHARRIATNLEALRDEEITKKLSSKIEKQARGAFALFADAMGAFHKRDADAANRILADVAAFQRGQDTVIRESLSLGGESILHVAYALESIGRTAAYAADISEVAINHTVAMGA
ncbi:MAG: PhoU domain-containing protein [Thermoplasmatota archaeon]